MQTDQKTTHKFMGMWNVAYFIPCGMYQ